MQPLVAEQQKARALRKKGLSYKEIQDIIPVSQASLSTWLKDIELTFSQKNRLKKLSVTGQEKGARARRQQRIDKTEKIKNEAQKDLLLWANDPFFHFGLALYWAEGSKQKEWNVSAQVSFANSDPTLIILIRNWFTKFFHIKEKDFFYTLFIHKSANQKYALAQWAELLGVNPKYIKTVFKHNEIKGRRKQDSYKGLIRIAVARSTNLNRKIPFLQEAVAIQALETNKDLPRKSTPTPLTRD